MIVAGEASGDLHGAKLARELLALDPHVALYGMGGEAMAAAGVEILQDIANLAVMGLVEVLGRRWDIRQAMRQLTEQFAKPEKFSHSEIILRLKQAVIDLSNRILSESQNHPQYASMASTLVLVLFTIC